MSKEQEEKRARIIAAQQAREAAAREAGQLPNVPQRRSSNWAASPPRRPRRGPGRPPASGR